MMPATSAILTTLPVGSQASYDPSLAQAQVRDDNRWEGFAECGMLSAQTEVLIAECYSSHMSELEFIVDQLNRAFDGEAWHGPAPMEILNGVDAETAAARPVPNGHSIWELVLHIAAWERVITKRLQGETLTLSAEEDFPKVRHATDTAWQEAIKTLRANHAQMIKAASGLGDKRLNEPAPGKDHDIRFMLTGAVQHAAYHGGQIALLKKAKS